MLVGPRSGFLEATVLLFWGHVLFVLISSFCAAPPRQQAEVRYRANRIPRHNDREFLESFGEFWGAVLGSGGAGERQTERCPSGGRQRSALS
eukprot:355797-Chlamydomonas_euryale.AAC.13